jgi:hypothetical protein
MGKNLVGDVNIALQAKCAPLSYVQWRAANPADAPGTEPPTPWTNDGDGDGNPDGVAETLAVNNTAANHNIDFDFCWSDILGGPPETYYLPTSANAILKIIAPTAVTF